MALDGNGTYSPPAPQFPAIPNTVIYADDFNQIILDIAAALSTAIFRDGQAAFTADQSLGGNKLTNVKNGTNPQDAATVLQVFTDPVFVATTLQGFKITGSMFQALMTSITLTASGLLDMSGSGQVKLPANTEVGGVSSAELAVLNGLTASTAELNLLDGALLTTAELNILAGTLVNSFELNTLDGITGNVQAQLNDKSFRTGDVYAGTHDYRTAVLLARTQDFADNSENSATTEFVKNVLSAVPLVNRNRAFFIGQL